MRLEKAGCESETFARGTPRVIEQTVLVNARGRVGRIAARSLMVNSYTLLAAIGRLAPPVLGLASNTTLAMSRPRGSAEELLMSGRIYVLRLKVSHPGEHLPIGHSAWAIGSDRPAGQSCQPPALRRVSKGFLRKRLARVHRRLSVQHWSPRRLG